MIHSLTFSWRNTSIRKRSTSASGSDTSRQRKNSCGATTSSKNTNSSTKKTDDQKGHNRHCSAQVHPASSGSAGRRYTQEEASARSGRSTSFPPLRILVSPIALHSNSASSTNNKDDHSNTDNLDKEPKDSSKLNMASEDSKVGPENAERLVSVYHPVFCQFTGTSFDSQRSVNEIGANNKARQKLIKLSKLHFLELCTDVYDELQRRVLQDQDPNVPSNLEARNDIHPKRNQARQRLAVLSTTRFNDLATDILFEIERRFPNVKSMYQNTDSNYVDTQRGEHTFTSPQPQRLSYEIHDEDAYRKLNSNSSSADAFKYDEQRFMPHGITVTGPEDSGDSNQKDLAGTYENLISSPPPIPEDDADITASGERKRNAKSMAFVSPTLPELDFSADSPALAVDARNSVASSRYEEDVVSLAGTPSQAFQKNENADYSYASNVSNGSSTVAQSLRGNVIIPQKSTLVEEDVDDDDDDEYDQGDSFDHHYQDGLTAHSENGQDPTGGISETHSAATGNYEDPEVGEPPYKGDRDVSFSSARGDEHEGSQDETQYYEPQGETANTHEQPSTSHDSDSDSDSADRPRAHNDPEPHNQRVSIASTASGSACGDDTTEYVSPQQEAVDQSDDKESETLSRGGFAEERRLSKRLSAYDSNMLDSITEEEGLSDINSGGNRALPKVSHSTQQSSGSNEIEKDEQLQMLMKEGTRLDDAVRKLEAQLDESETMKNTLMEENEQLHVMVSDLEAQRQTVNQQLADLESQLKEHQQTNEGLKTQVEAIPLYETKVRELSEGHETALTNLTTDHETKLKELSEGHENELAQLRETHESRVNDLSAEHDAVIADMATKHQGLADEVKNKHEAFVRELSEQHETNVNTLTSQHENSIKDLTNLYEEKIRAIVAEHESEKQELLSRIAILEESLNSNAMPQPHLDHVKELESRNAELEGHISTLKERHTDALNKQNGYAEESASLSNEIMMLQSKVGHYESRGISLDGDNSIIKGASSGDQTELKAKYEDLKRDHLALSKELEQQQKVTEQVQREASEFLEEMRHLVDNKKALDSAESLAGQVQSLKVEAQEWKNRYSRAKSQLRNIRASGYGSSNSIFQTTVIPNPNESPFTDANGLVRDVTVSKFQLSMDEFLISTRSSTSQDSFHYLHNVVVSTRAIAQELSDNNSLADESLQSRVAQANSLVSSIANQLITVTRNYTTSGGLSPLSVVDSAASDLAFAVIDLLKLVKIRPTNEKLDLSSPQLSSTGGISPVKNNRMSLNESRVSPVNANFERRIPSTSATPTSTTPTSATHTSATPTNVTPTNVTSTNVTPTNVTPTDVTPARGNGLTPPLSRDLSNLKNIRIPSDTRRFSGTQPLSPVSSTKQPVNTQPRMSSGKGFNNLVSPTHYSQGTQDREDSGDISMGFDAEDPDNTVAELQAYLERKTVDAVDSIQNLLTGIRKDVKLKSLLPHMDNVVNVANSMIEATGTSMQQTKNWLLKDKGVYILQNLEDCSSRLAVLYEDLEHTSLDADLDRQFRQRIAGVSFDMAKCTKELVKTVEEVSLTSEIHHIDSKLGF